MILLSHDPINLMKTRGQMIMIFYTRKHVISRKSFPIERKLERMHITRKGFARKLQKSVAKF
ncbi:unnamed protein product [Brassica oleracea var. botrytis]